MNKIYVFLTIMFVFTLLIGCDLNDQENEAEVHGEFPYHFISETFTYDRFDYPEEWDVTSVSSNVEMTYRDEENPNNHQYASTPYRYHFKFGRKAETNEVSEEVIEEFNANQAANKETQRQLFYHTSYDHYADFKLSSNGFLNILTEFEEVEKWEISDEPVMVLRQDAEWQANWYLNGIYYDLHVENEAGINDNEVFEQLLELMIDG
ncbi:hypothetical protein ACM26V_20020 [Salipaludibacillus sp. HK11]|uniref:hypothetical protein n=1 Tax=Salipaludibacillus sp. HK11 TaxID=3394320 RepID=UPI0039FD365F